MIPLTFYYAHPPTPTYPPTCDITYPMSHTFVLPLPVRGACWCCCCFVFGLVFGFCLMCLFRVLSPSLLLFRCSSVPNPATLPTRIQLVVRAMGDTTFDCGTACPALRLYASTPPCLCASPASRAGRLGSGQGHGRHHHRHIGRLQVTIWGSRLSHPVPSRIIGSVVAHHAKHVFKRSYASLQRLRNRLNLDFDNGGCVFLWATGTRSRAS